MAFSYIGLAIKQFQLFELLSVIAICCEDIKQNKLHIVHVFKAFIKQFQAQGVDTQFVLSYTHTTCFKLLALLFYDC